MREFNSNLITYSRQKISSELVGGFSSISILGAFTTAVIFSTLTGCASAPIPSEQFAISQAAIDSATTAGAPEYAPLEIKSARDKLTAAQRAVETKEYSAAAALSEEASVDAKLAETKAESEKAKKSVGALQDHLRTLNDEMQRNSQQQIQSEQKLQPGSGS